MDVRFCEGRNHGRETTHASCEFWHMRFARSSEARVGRTVFSLDKDLHGGRQFGQCDDSDATREPTVVESKDLFNFSKCTTGYELLLGDASRNRHNIADIHIYLRGGQDITGVGFWSVIDTTSRLPVPNP